MSGRKIKKQFSIFNFPARAKALADRRFSTNNGVALLVAILTSSIALLIGTSVLNIALKEIKISSFGKESVKAFYVADTGLECALYWDLVYPGYTESVFATSTNSSVLSSGSNLDCNTIVLTDLSDVWDYSNRTSNSATTTFTIQSSADINDPCANVTIAKYKNNFNRIVTKIDSRGLNSCDVSNPRRVERGLRVRY